MILEQQNVPKIPNNINIIRKYRTISLESQSNYLVNVHFMFTDLNM